MKICSVLFSIREMWMDRNVNSTCPSTYWNGHVQKQNNANASPKKIGGIVHCFRIQHVQPFGKMIYDVKI